MDNGIQITGKFFGIFRKERTKAFEKLIGCSKSNICSKKSGRMKQRSRRIWRLADKAKELIKRNTIRKVISRIVRKRR